MEGNVRIFRLKLSQHPDIVGIVSESADNADMYVMKYPHALVTSNKSGSSESVELQLIPYLPGYADESANEIEIRKTDVLLSFEPVSELRQRFNVMFGSGLVLPNGNNSVKIPTAQFGATLA